MIPYTVDDARVLYGMVNFTEDNVNRHAGMFNRESLELFFQPTANCDVEGAILRVIRFLARPTEVSFFLETAFIQPLEEMPLLINSDDKISVIAKWRMKIAK